MRKRFFISVIITMMVLFSFISCEEEIIIPEGNEGYKTPTIIGRITLPESAEIKAEDLWVKAVDGETTVYVGNVKSDCTFLVSGLDADKKYNILITTEQPDFENYKSKGSNGKGYGGWLNDVEAKIDEGNNVGTVKVRPLGTIKGVVTKDGSDDGYDTTIYIPGTSFMAMTDEDGSFSISNVPQSTSYRIRFISDDYMPQMLENVSLWSEDEEENPVTTLKNVTLIKNAGTVEGFAVLDGEDDNSGILIRLEALEGASNYTATTAKNGYFSIGEVKPGEYRVLCSYSGYPSQTSSFFKVNAAQTTTLGERIVLFENVGTITGSAFLSDDDSVKSGINISIVALDSDRSYSTLTDDSGKFNKIVYPGSYKVSASYAGYTTQSQHVVVYQGASASVAIPGLLPADGAISGSVVLEGSADSSGVVVTAVNALDSSMKANAVTDSDGSFSIRGLKSAGQYYLTYSKEGYIKNSSVVANVSLGNVSTVETVTLKSTTSKISGRVSLESAKDNTGITVLLKALDESVQYSTSTDQSGDYIFNRVLPGSYALYASKDGYETKTVYDIVVESSVEKTLDSQSLAVAIRSISGSVSLEGKDDYSGALITATNISDGTLIYSAITNSDGNYVLAGMIPGEYNISISSAAYNTVALPTVNVVANSTASLGKTELLLARGKIAGLVKLEGYTDYSEVKVSLLGTEYETTTAKDGSYEFNVPSGNYPGGIRYEKTDMETASYTATVPVLTASTYAIPDVMLNAISVPIIKGQLSIKNATSVDFDGITVKLAEKPEFVFVTEDDGKWFFEHVPLGDYTLEITRENTRKVTMNISVEASPEMVIPVIELIPDAASIEGNITLKDVSDYSGVTVRAVSSDGDTVKTNTNAAGYFYLGNILSSKAYTVYFEKAGWNSQSLEVSGLEPMSLTDITEGNAIELIDTEKPLFSDMTIIAGESVAEGRKVYIYAEAEDKGSGIKSVYINTENDFDEVDAIPYSSPFMHILPDVVGEQTVYAKLVDNAGNASDLVTKAITLKNHKNEVSGVLTGDNLTWTKDKSPYYVTGNILVEEGKTLTIEAGVNVQFAGEYYLVVDGTLDAQGTKDDNVLMYGVGDGEDSWLGINIRKGHESKIDNATIFGMGRGISGKLQISNSSISSYGENYCLGYNDWDNSLRFNGDIYNSTITGSVYMEEASIHSSQINIQGTESNINMSYLIGSNIEGSKVGIGASVVENCSFEDITTNLEATGSIYSTFRNSEVSITYGGTYIYDVFESCDIAPFSGTMIKHSNLIDCSSISTETMRVNVEEYDFTNNFWGYDKTTEMDVMGTGLNLTFITDYYDDFDIAKIKVGEYSKEPLEGIGYQGDDYYSEEESSVEYNIGDVGPAGGYIFYDKGFYSEGWRYLEAAPENIGNFVIFGHYRPTADSFILNSGTGLHIGVGKPNTKLLVETMGDYAYSKENGPDKSNEYAVKLCYDYEKNGYDDWFLPSRDELNLMYEVLHLNGIGSFSDYYYWSSSEYNNGADYAWSQTFSNGSLYNNFDRDTGLNIRLCRAF